MREALELLDVDNFPADIGAHLDLAIARLDGEMRRHNMLGGEQGPEAQAKAFRSEPVPWCLADN